MLCMDSPLKIFYKKLHIYQVLDCTKKVISRKMDVMKPEVIWIGTRCYRINPTVDMANNFVGTGRSGQTEAQPYIEHDEYMDDDENEDNYEVECNNGRYSTTFHIPQQFFAQVIGTKGNTRRRIESETKSQINVPKQGHDGDIKITSNQRKNVITARRRIEMMVIGGRTKLAFTHFLSIPMQSDAIQKSFRTFKEMILSDLSIYGINESCFQNQKKLHITIATLTLLDNQDRINAGMCLQDCKDIVDNVMHEYGSLEVHMKGLEIMNDDPTAVDILYGNIECEALQIISDQIYEYFVSKSLTQKKFDRVKLHVTLINTLFGMDSSKLDEGKRDRETFDASILLSKYKDFNFGKLNIKEIHLSQRYSLGSDGYYEASSIIKV